MQMWWWGKKIQTAPMFFKRLFGASLLCFMRLARAWRTTGGMLCGTTPDGPRRLSAPFTPRSTPLVS